MSEPPKLLEAPKYCPNPTEVLGEIKCIWGTRLWAMSAEKTLIELNRRGMFFRQASRQLLDIFHRNSMPLDRTYKESFCEVEIEGRMSPSSNLAIAGRTAKQYGLLPLPPYFIVPLLGLAATELFVGDPCFVVLAHEPVTIEGSARILMLNRNKSGGTELTTLRVTSLSELTESTVRWLFLRSDPNVLPLVRS